MNKITMLDTNMCGYIMKNYSAKIISRFNMVHQDDVFISSIVLSEIEYGVKKVAKHRSAVDGFLRVVNIIDFDEAAARHYADIRCFLESKGKVIGSHDLFIAAHARRLEATLITNNMREFERVPDLMLDNWMD